MQGYFKEEKTKNKKKQNAPRPSEHIPVVGGKINTEYTGSLGYNSVFRVCYITSRIRWMFQRKIRTHLDLLSIPRLWGQKCHLYIDVDVILGNCCLKKNQNAPRPSEHPPVRGEKLLFITFSVSVANPKKTTLHGGQSRSWSAEQGNENKRRSLAAYPPPPPHTARS